MIMIHNHELFLVDITIIHKLREKGVTWAIIGSAFNMKETAARMALKRDNDRLELGEIPVIKRSKFERPILLKLKELARDLIKFSIRDLSGELTKKA
jgi:hypothetical protein